jgi:hypothetical protein
LARFSAWEVSEAKPGETLARRLRLAGQLRFDAFLVSRFD